MERERLQEGEPAGSESLRGGRARGEGGWASALALWQVGALPIFMGLWSWASQGKTI